MNENKVYGNLNMISLMMDQHRKGKLNIKDLVRSMDKRVKEIKEELKK
ncbi:hypothetical protein [Bacillus cereus]|nr:hypothetical protein [Bacillus cereus]KIP28237.1 hypothetical protein BG10_6713 [Bacillus thuringiensis serovar morrisoni]